MKDIDRYRGCLVGGAAGDALGYAVEFCDESGIFSRYGERGITEYELDAESVARFSDDTQMTLFTANGLLLGTTRGMTRGIMGPYASYVGYCYGDWYRTQTEEYPLDEGSEDAYHYSWLVGLPGLFERRAPGNTCLSACAAGCTGTPSTPINHSKGCGGVMRVAPVGLYLDAVDGVHCDGHADVLRLGAECAALTHGHELGWLPAGALALIVSMLAHEPECDVRQAAVGALCALSDAYPDVEHVEELQGILTHAMRLADSPRDDLECIHELGEGWVAEEALAIAVFCALRHEHDFEAGVVAAVNHGGDSDSTGAMCGNILGARLGLAGIPSKFTKRLEMLDVIEGLADDLCHDCQIDEYTSSPDGAWEHKYIYNDYAKWTASREPGSADGSLAFERLSFGVGGFFQGSDEIEITRRGDAWEAVISCMRGAERRSRSYMRNEMTPFFQALAEAGVDSWYRNYYNRCVLDGTQWGLAIDGHSWSGSNAFPKGFDALLGALRACFGFPGDCDFEGEFAFSDEECLAAYADSVGPITDDDREFHDTDELAELLDERRAEARCLRDDVRLYVDAHPDAVAYYDILERNGIGLDLAQLKACDVSHASAELVVALLVGLLRAEDWLCSDVFADASDDGTLTRWLDRLQETTCRF